MSIISWMLPLLALLLPRTGKSQHSPSPAGPILLGNTVIDEAYSVLREALKSVPMGVQAGTATAENSVDVFKDISSHVDPNDLVFKDSPFRLGFEYLGHPSFRNISQGGILSDVLRSYWNSDTHEGIQTTVSALTFSCLCADDVCNETWASDLTGTFSMSAENGWYRFHDSLLLMDASAQVPLGCLSIVQIPFTSVEIPNCWIPEPPAPDHVLINDYLFLLCNKSDTQVMLKVSEGIVARSLNVRELRFPRFYDLPAPGDEDMSNWADLWYLKDALENPLFNYSFGSVVRRLEIFVTEHESYEGEMTEAFTELLRVLFAQSVKRLLQSTSFPDQSTVRRLLSYSPGYQAAIEEFPKSAALPLLILNAALFVGTGAVFGFTLGNLLHDLHERFFSWQGFASLSASLAAGLTFTGAAAAFILEWQKELQQTDYDKSLVLADVVITSRSADMFPLRVGHARDPFTASIYYVNVSDGSKDYQLLFIVATLVAFAFLFLFMVFGYRTSLDHRRATFTQERSESAI